jgi:uncharacterized protein YegP (UPF0339 family)
MSTITLFRDTEGQWRFRIEADNGEPIAQSEGYVRRIDALDTAKKLAPDYRHLIIEGE